MAYLFKEVSGNLYTGDSTSLQAQNREFWAQLLDYDGEKWYSWIEVQPTYGGTFVQLTGPRFGNLVPTLVYPAFNAQQDVVVPILTSTIGDPDGTYVKMRRAYFDPITSESPSTLQWVWVFDWSAPEELPEQSLTVVTNWECIPSGQVVLTMKTITGQFTISDPAC